MNLLVLTQIVVLEVLVRQDNSLRQSKHTRVEITKNFGRLRKQSMFIKISWDPEFDKLMMDLWSIYGKELFTIDGIGDQLDLNKFSKNFFSDSVTTTSDISVDANANVCGHTSLEYAFELPKPLRRYNSYFLLWKELRKLYGLATANSIIEKQLTGEIYINDFVDIAMPYCFNFSTFDIALNGLDKLVPRLPIVPAKNLVSFIRHIEQFTVLASNSTLGATGYADIMIMMAHYVDKILDTGYDGHIAVSDVESYVSEEIRRMIYCLNWPFRANQSSFTNVSVFDKYFLESLIPDYAFPDGSVPRIETVQMIQRLYLDAMNSELKRAALTFPVTTACFTKISGEEYEKIQKYRETGELPEDPKDQELVTKFKDFELNEIKDKEFLKFIAEENQEFGFINIYTGETSQLSSCCRLRSNAKNEYFNQFGAGSTKIGSLGVVTVNFPRIAMMSKDEDDFMEKLRQYFDIVCKINNAKRSIIKKRIKCGAAPLYTYGYMDINKQYSTFGICGLNEAISILGYEITEESGQNFVHRIIDSVNDLIDRATKKYKAPHNCEQVPAENSAVKLATKDKFLGYDCGAPLYSNQFIPLTTNADMLERIRVQGMFDSKFSGGAICHINVSEKIENIQDIMDLIEYAAKAGVVYWAINYRLYECPNHHLWVGSENCPVCGEHWVNEITRVVGFFTNTKNWNPVRRKEDWPNRVFYDVNTDKSVGQFCKHQEA